jgi:hypothetical protein
LVSPPFRGTNSTAAFQQASRATLSSSSVIISFRIAVT